MARILLIPILSVGFCLTLVKCDLVSKINLLTPNLESFSTKKAPSVQEIENDRRASQDDYQGLELIYKSIPGLLAVRGYRTEPHFAPTKDGYYINLVRIINPLVSKPPKRPVIFNHGLMENAAIWLLSSRDIKPEDHSHQCQQLPMNMELTKNQTEFLNGPMMLANHGYDVWMMSARGTDYSKYHRELDPSAPEFWNFSLDDFALDDVPSAVNYVRTYTNKPKVGYAGYSQATTTVLALLAAEPQYAQAIEPVFLVAPVFYMHHTTSVARKLFMTELLTPKVQGPVPEVSRQIREKFWQYCGKDKWWPFKLICRHVDNLAGGRGSHSLKSYLSFFPHTTSHKVLRHFGQIISKHKFTRYDHGPEENQKRYGQKEAPPYNIGSIQSKSIVFYSTRTDSLAPVEDVAHFKSELNVPLYRDIFVDRKFNHFDLITHNDARFLTFGPMLEVLEEFEHRDGGFCASHLQGKLESVRNKLQN